MWSITDNLTQGNVSETCHWREETHVVEYGHMADVTCRKRGTTIVRCQRQNRIDWCNLSQHNEVSSTWHTLKLIKSGTRFNKRHERRRFSVSGSTYVSLWRERVSTLRVANPIGVQRREPGRPNPGENAGLTSPSRCECVIYGPSATSRTFLAALSCPRMPHLAVEVSRAMFALPPTDSLAGGDG